jgi:hypothetical protein
MTSTLRRTEKHEVLAYNATSVFVSVPDEFEPATFRFSDRNPLDKAKSYAASQFRHLPTWAACVVRDAGYRPGQWNELVRAGSVLEQDAFRAEYPLAAGKDWDAEVARRDRKDGPAGKCPDCWGTGLAPDWDGSVTGVRVGAPFVCFCLSGW